MSLTLEYDKLHPFDDSVIEKMQVVPKWQPGIDQRLITKEMRAERESIRAFNMEVSIRNSERIMANNKWRNQALLDFAVSAGLDFADLANSEEAKNISAIGITSRLRRDTDVAYRIDEVDVL